MKERLFEKKKFTKEDIDDMEEELTIGNRLEVIPVKDGIRIMKIKREDLHKKKVYRGNKK